MELLEIPLVTLSACVVGHGLDIGHTPSVESVPKKSLLGLSTSKIWNTDLVDPIGNISKIIMTLHYFRLVALACLFNQGNF